MTIRNTLAAILLAGTLFAGSTASADEDMLSIVTTQVASIDEVFTPISDIHTKLEETRTSLASIDENIRTALGVAADAPLETALADFKAQAGDALQVTMDGATPQLTVADAAPDNIVAGVDAIKAGMDALQAIVTELPTLKDDASAAVAAAQGIDPKSLVGDIRDSGQKVGKTLKTFKNNLKSTGQTPDHVTTTLTAATDMMSTLVSPFSG
jgi:hypothetical protein